MAVFDTKSANARNGPCRPVRPHASVSGTGTIPAVNRPDGGSEMGESRRTTPKSQASTRPSTKTGIEMPMLANSMVITS